MSASVTHRESFLVPASHPALPGHFPGQPVVPGVVLLDAVIAAAERLPGPALQIEALTSAKFMSPLLPDQSAWIELIRSEARLTFSIRLEARELAIGEFRLAAAPGSAAGAREP